MTDALRRLFDFLFPIQEYRVPAAVLFLVILLLASAFLFPRLKSQRPNLLLCIVISALLLMVLIVDSKHRWQWIVGLLPTFLVGYQLFSLWQNQPRKIDRRSVNDEKALQRAQTTILNQFGLKTLFIRYGLPAVLLGIAGIVAVDILVEPENFFSLMSIIDKTATQNTVTNILLGLRLGAIGAYVYVLLELGRRTFRHDVTGASAMWCFVTLVLGPILAATVAVLWRIGPPPAEGWWGGGVILFFAGFAPRRVIAAIEQAALQLLKVGAQNTVVESRLIPLTKIRGISPQIEERLSEEGILDVNSLAAAEPVRLLRNTRFDLRQILSWIDEAILIVTLPKSWGVFEEEGITGALGLAWYCEGLFESDGSLRKELAETPIPALAKKGNIEEANLLSTIRRLSQDPQVRYVETLYHNFTDNSGSQPADANAQNQDGGSGDL